MSAERIASAIKRMQMGCIVIPQRDHPKAKALDEVTRRLFTGKGFTFGEIVDVTSIYDDFLSADEGVFLYEDTMMAPPLMEATYCYYSTEGNFTAAVGASTYLAGSQEFEDHLWADTDRSGAFHDLDWDKVKWITATALYIFGDDHPTAVGPVASWRFAIAEDGSVLDINWKNPITDINIGKWDNAVAVFCKAVTWMNCRNIELVEPVRSRPEQRRLRRYDGISVKELHIRPIGKTYRYDQSTKVGGAVPLHSVRGHLAKYGIDGRKKLFGRITGVFWIPAHARGSKEHGEHQTTRILDTG